MSGPIFLSQSIPMWQCDWRLILPFKTKVKVSFCLSVSLRAGVEVDEGVESVLLTCQVPTDVSRDSTAAVWDRKDLNIPTVHVRLQSGDDLEQQNNRYTDRTSMRADALQTGDLSLTLRNPTVSDSGTYTCTTRKFGRDQTKTYVQLKVTEKEKPQYKNKIKILPSLDIFSKLLLGKRIKKIRNFLPFSTILFFLKQSVKKYHSTQLKTKSPEVEG
uniref:Ig-like domain-containing protein n=1 Tax=Amphilophus citrinellus TaxID=61819 RepID=A0A3Q0RT64_AMPCI